VSIGTILQYFANEEEVFDTLIRREIDGLIEVLHHTTLVAFTVASAAEGVAINESPDLQRRRAAEELAMMFTRYVTASGA
jgi:AcrR family transcriptional regulator